MHKGEYTRLLAENRPGASAIIENMSVLFAIGVAYGISKDKDGAAALTAFVGFLVVTTLCTPASVPMIQKIPLDHVPAVFGKINNQFVGILVGVISAELYNRFSHVELTKALSFFSGRRLVPILVSFVMIFNRLYPDVHLDADLQCAGGVRRAYPTAGFGGSRYLRLKVAGIMLAAAFASFFTGITEPLEFSFVGGALAVSA